MNIVSKVLILGRKEIIKMRITREKIKELPDGTKLKIFLSGCEWGGDFGKSITVFKFKDQLFEYRPFCEIEDIDSGDSLDIQAAIDTEETII
jgi:hypothetical protein